MEKNYIKKKNIEVIAEIANSHQGKPSKAYELALAFWKAGASAIKFQIYFAEELLSSNHSRYKHFEEQSFNVKTWNQILRKLKKKKIKIYCDIFGEKAFKVATQNKVDGFKIHSSDLNNSLVLNKLLDNKKKYFLSTGGSTLKEIAYALKILNKNKIKPVLLHGFQSYPTDIIDCNLNRLKTYKKIFKNKCELGYQDHTSGDDPMNFIIPQIALGYGVKYIEKHVTFSRKKKGVDYYSSIEPKEFRKFISIVKKSFLSTGSDLINFSDNEKKYRKEMKKIWHAKTKIKENQLITKKNIIMKRPATTSVCPYPIENFLGKKLKKEISPDTPITKDLFTNKIVATIVVRSKSQRLPNKALKKICKINTIEHLINRVKKSKEIKQIILCTTKSREDRIFKKIAQKNKINFFAGDDKDVLKRMLQALKNTHANTVIRITGDDILIDPFYADLTINHHLCNNLDYTNNKALPSGMEVEVFDIKTLEQIYDLAFDTSGSEYLTFYINRYKDQFNTDSIKIKKKVSRYLKLTLDTKKDFNLIKNFLENMNKKNKISSYNLDDVLKFYKLNKSKFINNKKKIKGIDINTKFDWKKII